MRALAFAILLLLPGCQGLRTESTDRVDGAAAAPVQVASIPKMEPARIPDLAPAPTSKKSEPGKAPSPPANAKRGPRTVDFRCPAGQAPGGVVRAGCMCGNLILGDACGAGGFTDVTPTATGCRFTCD